MTYKLDASDLQDDCRRQVLLAALAETDEVRLVHLALEQLYRTQLAAMELAARLDCISGSALCACSPLTECPMLMESGPSLASL